MNPKTLTGYAGLMQAAQDNWPEDEAGLTFETFSERMKDARDETDRRNDCGALIRDAAHMHRVFGREADGPQLVARYDLALVRLVKERHAHAFAKLAEYAAEDAQALLELTPVLDARSVQEMAAAREALQPYLPCSALIDELHAELGRFIAA